MPEHRMLSEVAMESETAVAGSILIDPRCLDEVRRHVTADAFLFENCREVFSVACQLADNGETIDPVRILDRSKTLDRDFLLRAMEVTPTAARAGMYAKIVTREALRRDYIEKLSQAVDNLTAGQDPVYVASEVQGESERVAKEEVDGQVVGAAQAALELLDDMQRVESGYKPFLPTGYRGLDAILGGGMIREGLYILAARPGCGKTTFLNLLTRLIPQTSGEILIDGEPADPKKHNISFVFQEPSAFSWLTTQENIEYGLRIKKMPEEYIKQQSDKVISLLGLDRFRNAYPHEMSVSMEQRVVIGRAFAMNPDLLLMDEPYGQMDIKMRFFLEDEVIKLWKATGATVLFITHNLEEAVYLAERVLVLSAKPATIKAQVPINIERPRKVSDPAFIEVRKQITDMIKWW